MSVNGKASLDFSDNAKTVNTFGLTDKSYKMHEGMPLAFGKLLDFVVRVDELTLWEGDKQLSDEAAKLNGLISNTREFFE